MEKEEGRFLYRIYKKRKSLKVKMKGLIGSCWTVLKSLEKNKNEVAVIYD